MLLLVLVPHLPQRPLKRLRPRGLSTGSHRMKARRVYRSVLPNRATPFPAGYNVPRSTHVPPRTVTRLSAGVFRPLLFCNSRKKVGPLGRYLGTVKPLRRPTLAHAERQRPHRGVFQP